MAPSHRYFPIYAKGLGPAIVAEMSGLPWEGPGSLGWQRDCCGAYG